MKRRLLRFIMIVALSFSLFLTACVREEINEGGRLDPDEQNIENTEEDDIGQQDTAAPVVSDAEGSDIDASWNVLTEVRERMNGLTALEENQLLYTKIEDSEESITLRLTMTGIGGEDFTLGAAGSVKTQGNVIPLEIYYRNKTMVRISGGNKDTADSTEDEALATVDFLRSIRRDLTKECLTSAVMTETVDGIKTVSILFEGTISGLSTTGRGEILIDPDGLISSEGYSFEAVNKDGKKVSQSVECTLLACNADVNAVDLPPELK